MTKMTSNIGIQKIGADVSPNNGSWKSWAWTHTDSFPSLRFESGFTWIYVGQV